MSQTKEKTFEELCQDFPEYQIFEMIKVGELIPVDRMTGQPLPCPPDFHEFNLPTQRPAEIQAQADELFDLELSRRCLAATHEDGIDHSSTERKQRLSAYFGMDHHEVTVEMLEKEIGHKSRLVDEYDHKQQIRKNTEDPERKNWKHLVIPRYPDHGVLLKAYLHQSVLRDGLALPKKAVTADEVNALILEYGTPARKLDKQVKKAIKAEDMDVFDPITYKNNAVALLREFSDQYAPLTPDFLRQLPDNVFQVIEKQPVRNFVGGVIQGALKRKGKREISIGDAYKRFNGLKKDRSE